MSIGRSSLRARLSQGIGQALDRVRAPGVLIEGNSFLSFIETDFAVMVARPDDGRIKASARRALGKTSALFVFEDGEGAVTAPDALATWGRGPGLHGLIDALPVYTPDELPQLIARLEEIHRKTHQ